MNDRDFGYCPTCLQYMSLERARGLYESRNGEAKYKLEYHVDGEGWFVIYGPSLDAVLAEFVELEQDVECNIYHTTWLDGHYRVYPHAKRKLEEFRKKNF